MTNPCNECCMKLLQKFMHLYFGEVVALIVFHSFSWFFRLGKSDPCFYKGFFIPLLLMF